jgi:hypothetical protein
MRGRGDEKGMARLPRAGPRDRKQESKREKQKGTGRPAGKEKGL